MNTESVNLYAEHLLKEMGKQVYGRGTLDNGLKAVTTFLDTIGLDTSGMFIGDGSGLSPQDAINPVQMVNMLIYMKNKSSNWNSFYNSLPEAGKEGTLKNYFRDTVFENRLRAKSGTLTRIKAYAGYLTTMSGRELAFCIIVNNFTGSSVDITRKIEEILSETILSK